MSDKFIRTLCILLGVLILLASFAVKRNWLKVLLLIWGAIQIAGNLPMTEKYMKMMDSLVQQKP